MKKLLIVLFSVALIVTGCGSKTPIAETPLYKDVFLFMADSVNMLGQGQAEQYLDDKGIKYEVEKDEDGYRTMTVDAGDYYKVTASFWPDRDDPDNEDLVTLADVSYGNDMYGVEVGVDPNVGVVLGSDEYVYYTYDAVNKGNGGIVKDMDAINAFVDDTLEKNRK